MKRISGDNVFYLFPKGPIGYTTASAFVLPEGYTVSGAGMVFYKDKVRCNLRCNGSVLMVDNGNEETLKIPAAPTFYTHSAKPAHSDDILSEIMLRTIGINVVRVPRSEMELIRTAVSSDRMFDCGDGKYDHHSGDPKKNRNGIPMSSFGLLFEDFGTKFLSEVTGLAGEELDGVVRTIEEDIVQYIDMVDNGIDPGKHKYGFLPGALKMHYHEGSEEGYKACKHLFFKCIERSLESQKAQSILKRSLSSTDTPGILVLEQGVPWSEFVDSINRDLVEKNKKASKPHEFIDFVIHEIEGERWILQCVETVLRSRTYRKELSFAWRFEDFRPPGCIYVAKGMHQATFVSKESAILAAKMLLSEGD